MKRNYGIDFLRIISMFMVAVLHVLAQGGILRNAEPQTLKYWVAWLLEIASYCAVNCFALISGYVMYRTEHKVSRLLKLWLQTVFYTGLSLVFFCFFMPDVVGKRTILNAIFPITSTQYWYISAYFGMLILVPLFNMVIHHAEKKVFGTALLTAFAAFCILPVVFQSNPYRLDSGYSLIWLSLLYLAGGYIHKYDVISKIKTSYAWYTALAMLAISFLTKFVIEQFLHGVSFLQAYNNAFISFTSPTIVLIAVGLLIICCKLNFKPRSGRAIGFLSSAALGVYLSHVNPLVWTHLIRDFAVSFLDYNCFSMVCLIILSAFLIFAAGIVIDLVRIKLFDLLGIHKLCTFLDTKSAKIQDKV